MLYPGMGNRNSFDSPSSSRIELDEIVNSQARKLQGIHLKHLQPTPSRNDMVLVFAFSVKVLRFILKDLLLSRQLGRFLYKLKPVEGSATCENIAIRL